MEFLSADIQPCVSESSIPHRQIRVMFGIDDSLLLQASSSTSRQKHVFSLSETFGAAIMSDTKHLHNGMFDTLDESAR